MIAEKIKKLLPSEWPTTIGDLPSPNAEAIGILEYDGAASTEYFGGQSGSSVFNPIVKIVFRGKSYPELRDRAEQTRSILHRYHDADILSILIVGSPVYLGRNEQKLHEFQVVFKIQVKE